MKNIKNNDPNTILSLIQKQSLIILPQNINIAKFSKKDGTKY